jgi:hypothetical protein
LPIAHSVCTLDAANVLLLALKPAEDGDGPILRLLDTAGQATQVMVALPDLTVLYAYATNLVEENQALLPTTVHAVQVEIAACGMPRSGLSPWTSACGMQASATQSLWAGRPPASDRGA